MQLNYDNASTSFPKPQQVAEDISNYLTHVGATYGRAAYGRVLQASAYVEQCRDLLSEKMGLSNGNNLFFTSGATAAVNTILHGLCLQGRVLVSPLEHNAVMRPLYHLEAAGKITIEILPHDLSGVIDSDAVAALDLSGVSLVVVNHQSNVNGAIQPVGEVCRTIRRSGGVPVLVDASQSFGNVPVCAAEWEVDYIVWTGHKGLLGPTGIGGFYAKTPQSITPLLYGGTGSRSDSYDMPAQYPDRFEAGTPNVTGIVGLLAALENTPQRQHSRDEFVQFMAAIEALAGVCVHRAGHAASQGELFSLTHESFPTSELCGRLYEFFGLEMRHGLHCAPLAHKTLGTFPCGTLRVAPSVYHTGDDFRYFVESLHTVLTSLHE